MEMRYIGMDPWVGCKWRHHLPKHLLHRLHFDGFYFLKYIGCPGVTLLMEQGWLSADIFGLVDSDRNIFYGMVLLLFLNLVILG